ncbi:four-carbon acid sugar kinase family protein [Consotaella aegiceratis]|uniref:four-carbon acid sugar kinase family protein n=1 Tax=Consotaella aegiceratis TaxID=3097961 RepID=UPI002F420653
MIADDLTGALDASAPFAQRGIRAAIQLDPAVPADDLPADLGLLCINTASRELPEDEACRRVAAAAATLDRFRPDIVFKKIDSRTKGHVVAESRVVAAATGRSTVLFCPAIPDLGRTVWDQCLFGVGVDKPLPLRPLATAIAVAAEIPQAATQADLDAAARLLTARPEATLAVGARGLAASLATLLGPAAPDAAGLPFRPRLPLVFAIGSRDPITIAQSDRLTKAADVMAIKAPNGHLADGPWSAGLTLIRVVAGDEPEDGRTVAERFTTALADKLYTQTPRCLLVSGGEVAQSLLRALDVRWIEVLGEALPGVPFMQLRIGGREVTVMTKSGGFGDPETLARLANACATADPERDPPFVQALFQ